MLKVALVVKKAASNFDKSSAFTKLCCLINKMVDKTTPTPPNHFKLAIKKKITNKINIAK